MASKQNDLINGPMGASSGVSMRESGSMPLLGSMPASIMNGGASNGSSAGAKSLGGTSNSVGSGSPVRQTTSGTTKKTTTASPYTYSDFEKAAKKAEVLSSFDANDLDFAQKYPEFGLSMISLYRDLGKAKTNEQKLLATEAMNQLRKNYGSYWTGESGNRSYATSYGTKIADAMEAVNNYADYDSAYQKQIQNALKQITGYGDFQYGNEKDYQKLLDSVVNREAFSYDPETDPLYGSYKKMYNREGDRAAANALAQAAAATGGVPSSYAATAAAQAGNYYAAQLADMVPELRNQALNEYNNEYSLILQALGALDTDRSQKYQVYGDRYSRLLQNLDALQGQDQTEYGRYTDRYNRLQQALQNLQGQDESDYKRYLDMVNAEYQRDRDAVTDAQQEWNNAWTIYQQTGIATGPIADLLGSGETAAGGGGGGTGTGSGGAGGGTRSVKDMIGVTEESVKSGKVTVPAYKNGKQTTVLVTPDKAKSATQAYIDEAARRGDITMEERATLSAELAKPGSTGPAAQLAAIDGDLRRGAITAAQADAKRKKVMADYNKQKQQAAAVQQAGTGGGDYSGGIAYGGTKGAVNTLAGSNPIGSRSQGTAKDTNLL